MQLVAIYAILTLTVSANADDICEDDDGVCLLQLRAPGAEARRATLMKVGEGFELKASGTETAKEEETCDAYGGITAINPGKHDQEVCCHADCGTCGGAGCNGLPGGAKACCVAQILTKQPFCSATQAAPCKVAGPDDVVVATTAEPQHESSDAGCYTKEETGERCLFDPSRSDCAVCHAGGCQCSVGTHNRCVKCGNNFDCLARPPFPCANFACPEMDELVVAAQHGKCSVPGRSISELIVTGLFDDNVEIKSVRYTADGSSGFDLIDIQLNVGRHEITIEALDIAGNTRQCARHVVVEDRQHPTWHPDPSLSKFSPQFATNQCAMSGMHAVNQFEKLGWNGQAKDNCPGVTTKKIVRSLSGEILFDSETSNSVGELTIGAGLSESYEIVYTAIDATGHEVAHAVELFLSDQEKPSAITGCPADESYEVGEDETGAVHTWELPSITKDNCNGRATFPLAHEVNNLAPGHNFPFGSTVVNYVLKDAAGNAYAPGCDFTVTVKQHVIDPPWMECPHDLSLLTEVDADFGIFPELTGSIAAHATLDGNDIPVVYLPSGVERTYAEAITPGMPVPFGVTHLSAWAVTSTHIAQCTFKVMVGDTQRPKVDGRVYRCMDIDTDLVEPYGVCDGRVLTITKDDGYFDTHEYDTHGVHSVYSECCNDQHGTKYTCQRGGDVSAPWAFKYCLRAPAGLTAELSTTTATPTEFDCWDFDYQYEKCTSDSPAIATYMGKTYTVQCEIGRSNKYQECMEETLDTLIGIDGLNCDIGMYISLQECERYD